MSQFRETTAMRWAKRLMMGTASVALFAGAAYAQADQASAPSPQKPAGGGLVTPDNAAPASADIVVTGTHIRGVAPVGSPIIAVTRKDIEATGATTTAEVLELQPQIFNYGISPVERSGTGGSTNDTYGTAINLRGLSPYATLTLIDGERVDPSGTVGSAVDPSTIPTIMLQRVDIVPDGASATYGSDAIAGVVNLILRRGFEGVEASALGGWGANYNENQFNAIMGHKWDSGQITVGFESAYNSALNGADRSFYSSNLTAEGGSDQRGNACSPGTINYNNVNYAIPAGGVTPATAGSLVPGSQNLCDPLKYQDLLPQQQQYDAAFTFDQDITDWLSVSAEGFYSYRSYNRAEPLASGPLTVTSANPYFVAVPGNTTNQPETVNYWFGNQGLGNTFDDYGHTENYDLIFGFKIKLPYEWQWQTTASYGHDFATDDRTYILASAPGVAAALASTNPAMALNLFGPNSTALLRSLDNDIQITPGTTNLYDVETKVDGPLFSLPGGQVRAAAGYEFEENTLYDGIIAGTTQGPFSPFPFQNLQRSSNSFYGELLVPIVGPDNAVPGVQRLDLDAGVRYTDYTVVGATTNPKIGLNWTVTNNLKLHASWGTSFRAPELSELVGPVTGVIYQVYATPTGPVGGYTLAGGNLGLKPETATTWSIGGDWTPSFLPNVRISLNYFNIDYSNQISSYLANLNILEDQKDYGSIITNCPSAACTALIDKYVLGTGPNPSPEMVLGPILNGNQIGAFVNGLEENLGTTLTDGIDFQFDYRVPDTAFGDFDLGVNGTYYLSFKESLTTGAPVVSVLNTIGFPLRLRLRGDVAWSDGPWNGVVFVNYENGYTNNLATPVQQVSSYTTVDLHLTYSLDAFSQAPWLKGTRVGVDVTNLFDTEPPFVNIIPSSNGGGGYDPSLANPIGRIVAVTIDKKFF